MKLIKVFLLLLSTLSFSQSFSTAKKKLLKKVYYDHQETIYCQNPYQVVRIKGKEKARIVQDSTKYSPRNILTKKGKVNKRALRIEWEHIMPAWQFGHQLRCWQKGGRKACRKDKLFKKLESDMYNLAPAIGEVNADRSNYRFNAARTDEGLKGQYGACEFKVNFKEKKAYPSSKSRGEIARAYLYMNKKYGIQLSKAQLKLYQSWNKMYPVSDWEKLRAKRISKLQKNKNSFIQ
jgi:deoxyribonuclease I